MDILIRCKRNMSDRWTNTGPVGFNTLLRNHLYLWGTTFCGFCESAESEI